MFNPISINLDHSTLVAVECKSHECRGVVLFSRYFISLHILVVMNPANVVHPSGCWGYHQGQHSTS